MFNLYQTISRKEDADKEPQTTGHDRFCTHQDRAPRSYYRHRKRSMTRRAESASELNIRPDQSAKLGLRKQRSVCTDEEVGKGLTTIGTVSVPGERTPLLANPLDSLSKLFSCVALSTSVTNSSNARRSQGWVDFVTQQVVHPSSVNFSFWNPILFAILLVHLANCAKTCIQWHVEECSLAFL
jgi:hypothetical protein